MGRWIFVAVLVHGCTSPQEPATTTTPPTAATSTTTSTTAAAPTTTTTLPPEEAASIAGTWVVTYYQQSIVGLNVPAEERAAYIGNTTERVWVWDYDCDLPPCGLTGDSFAASRRDPFPISADFSGGTYVLTETGTAECFIGEAVTPDAYTFDITFRIQTADLVESEQGWVANRLHGARRVVTTPTPDAAAEGCEGGEEEYVVRAVRAVPSAPSGFGIVTSPAERPWEDADWQGEARVEGPWMVTWTMLSPSGPDADRFAEAYLEDQIGSSNWARWVVTPRCAEGSCDMDVEAIETAFTGQPTSYVFAAAPSRSSFRTHIGDTLAGNCNLPDGSQTSGYTIHDALRFDVVSAVEDDPGWLASEIVGHWAQVWRGERPDCPTATIEFFFRGVRTDIPPYTAPR